jgi:ADP-ribosylglycohydrolase
MPHRTATTRIHDGLLAAGIGDALGAPTEQYTMAEIAGTFGPGLIDRFHTPPPDTFAGANGGLAGEITDDASQMYYLARALARKGADFTNADWIACLLDWRDTSPKAGFMGPSTEALVRALKAGTDPTVFGRIGTSTRKMTNIGTTNGAAMRVAPVGMAFPGDIARTARYTLMTCLPSHDASVAIEAACAVACATGQAMVSGDLDQVLQAAMQGAVAGRDLAARHGRLEAGPRFQARLLRALDIAGLGLDDMAFLARLEGEVGNSVLAAESVPCALAILAQGKGDAWHCVRLAATIGNDSDSIAAMVGAIAGTMSGVASIPADLITQFQQANPDFDLQAMAQGLSG